MKTIIKSILIGVLSGFLNISCQDVEVGYLITEYAGYGLDSMIIKVTIYKITGK